MVHICRVDGRRCGWQQAAESVFERSSNQALCVQSSDKRQTDSLPTALFDTISRIRRSFKSSFTRTHSPCTIPQVCTINTNRYDVTQLYSHCPNLFRGAEIFFILQASLKTFRKYLCVGDVKASPIHTLHVNWRRGVLTCGAVLMKQM